jgi:colanic acid/amylovoran biosynthesis protein
LQEPSAGTTGLNAAVANTSHASIVKIGNKTTTKFLISQAYSTYNKGEAAIGISLIESIKAIYPDADISIMTPAPEQAREQYQNLGVKTYPRLVNTSSSHKGLRKISNISKILFCIISYLLRTKIGGFPLGKSNRLAFELFRNADVIIIAGGGTFGGAKYRSITGNLFPIYLAKKLGKKVMVYAPSVEPFTSKIIKHVTRSVLNQADLITVREQFTFDLLRSIGIKVPLYLTADPAFLIGSEPLNAGTALLMRAGVPVGRSVNNSNNNDPLLIGITIRDWNFARQKDSGIKRKKYLYAIRQAIERILLTRPNAVIVVFTTSINASFGDDDRITANLIKSGIKDNNLTKRVHVLTQDYTAQETKAMIGNMDIFIATRFHSAVFAFSMNIPTMMIATEIHKNQGLMKMMNLEDYTLEASSVTSDNIFRTANKLIEQRNHIAEQIRERMILVRKQSMQNIEHLQNMFMSL